MDEFAATALAVVWSSGPWRCVYCTPASDQAWVVLYYRNDIALKRRVLGIEEMRDTAMLWKEAMGVDRPPIESLVPPPTLDRRQLPHRRRVARGGRRVSDLRR